jgi:hypothetical protein
LSGWAQKTIKELKNNDDNHLLWIQQGVTVMATGSNDSNTPNLEQLMQLGIQTARKGNRSSARVIFQQIIDTDKTNERAWLWMAAIAESSEDRLRYLNAVLRIDPDNPTALRELEKMKRKQVSSNTLVIRYGMMGLFILLLLIVITIALLSLS